VRRCFIFAASPNVEHVPNIHDESILFADELEHKDDVLE
jgi:hypothetical protein